MSVLDDEIGNGKSKNPCKKFIQFKGGKFKYWDKAAEKNVEIPIPFGFTVIGEMQTCKGWHKPSNSAIYSNEVYRGQQQMTVRSFKGGEIAKGYWRDIKDSVKASGGRFCNSVYAVMDNEVVNFQLTGAGCSAWINKEPGDIVKVQKLEDKKNGATEYKVPVFEAEEANEDDRVHAKEVGTDLISYLKEYLKGSDGSEYATADDLKDLAEDKPEDLPF